MLFLVLIAMGVFAVFMFYAVHTLDCKIKSGSDKAAVVKACIVTVCPAAMIVLLLLSLAGIHHLKFDPFDCILLVALSYGALDEWRKAHKIYREQHGEQSADM